MIPFHGHGSALSTNSSLIISNSRLRTKPEALSRASPVLQEEIAKIDIGSGDIVNDCALGNDLKYIRSSR